ncbi:MAG: homoserine O-acetyltransferase, partial [Pseudomonadota bacterium]
MADGATLESAAPVSPATRLAILAAPFHCERGGKIDQPVLAYRTWGKLNSARDNVILICHALTGSADVDDWWPGLLGSGCPIDTDRWFVVCSNVLGGCYGSSGPYSRGQHGRRLGLDFPQVTIRDMVRAQQQLLEQLGIERVHCVLGPSLGGMQAIEWTTSFSDRVSRQMLIGSSARHSSWCIGISETQRAALRADPNWRGGHYSDAEPPAQGLAAARMIAMVSYRSWQNFDQRFSRTTADNGQFAVNSYLQYQGQKLVGRFDAASYHRLTEAMDS